MEIESLEVDQEAEALRDMGRNQDLNEGRPTPEPQSAETPESRAPGEAQTQAEPQAPETGEPEQQQPESSDIEPKQQQLGRDESGRFQKRDTEYSRAQKEQERRDRSWAALQDQKEAFRQQQAMFQENLRLQQLNAARQYQPPKKDGLTRQEYFEGAQRLEAAGDHASALQAWKVGMEMQGQEIQQLQQAQLAQKEFSWRQQMDHAMRVNPEIFNPQSPIMQTVDAILVQRPDLYYLPDGFSLVAAFADATIRLGAMSELQDENESLRAELEKLQKRSQPLDGRVTGAPRGEKNFDDLSLEDQEIELRRLTAEADNYR